MVESIFTVADIFPMWTAVFHEDPAIAKKLGQVREIRSRRAEGIQQLPDVYYDDVFWYHLDLYLKIRNSEATRQGLPWEGSYSAHKACIDTFTPIVHRAFWGRWLYLERAFEIASRSGDLLFGAIVLRTMAEDVWALLELARFEELCKACGDMSSPEHFQAIKRHGDLLWARFLPPRRDFPELPDSQPVEPFNKPEYDQLKQTFHRLNDYVHPNYGSHLLALFPERSVALGVLLDAYITIYEWFFKVPGVQGEATGQSSPLPPVVVRPWHEEAEFCKTHYSRNPTSSCKTWAYV